MGSKPGELRVVIDYVASNGPSDDVFGRHFKEFLSPLKIGPEDAIQILRGLSRVPFDSKWSQIESLHFDVWEYSPALVKKLAKEMFADSEMREMVWPGKSALTLALSVLAHYEIDDIAFVVEVCPWSGNIRGEIFGKAVDRSEWADEEPEELDETIESLRNIFGSGHCVKTVTDEDFGDFFAGLCARCPKSGPYIMASLLKDDIWPVTVQFQALDILSSVAFDLDDWDSPEQRQPFVHGIVNFQGKVDPERLDDFVSDVARASDCINHLAYFEDSENPDRVIAFLQGTGFCQRDEVHARFVLSRI
jgi:hypothetical protein